MKDNIFSRLANARLELKKSGLKMTGKNKYADYEYFDLIDFLPKITEIENNIGILSVVSFTHEMAALKVFNSDNPSEFIEFTSPMASATLKGCHDVQNLGAVETYIRRYLYNIAYEIVECDPLNKTQRKDEKKPQSKPLTEEELKSLGVTNVQGMVDWICKKYQINDLSELTEEQAEKCRNSIKNRKKISSQEILDN